VVQKAKFTKEEDTKMLTLICGALAQAAYARATGLDNVRY